MLGLVTISDNERSPNQLFSEYSGLFFEIRPPQRRFKWKPTQVRQLWEDIFRAYQNKSESYFLGSLLLVPIPNADNKASVIDGQQRITTLSLLLAVLRDEALKLGLTGRADGIQRLIGRVDNSGNPIGALVVTLQEPDNNVYSKLVKERGSTTHDTVGKSLLEQAVEVLKSKVADYVASSTQKTQELEQLGDYIQDKVKLLPLEVATEAQGYLVFDTTNTRGLEPTQAESLKARLATIPRDDSQSADQVIKKWDATVTKFESTDLGMDVMGDYIHAIWSSVKGYTPKGKLSQIATEIEKSEGLPAFLKDLEDYLASYLAVVDPSGNSSLSEDLRDLKGLNVQSSGFLTMVHKHFNNRFAEGVGLVLSLQIRNITVGTRQANAYERDWPNWAMLVRKGEVNQAFAEIRSAMVSDDEFSQEFEKKVLPSAITVRHLLRRLDPISEPGSGVQPVEVDVEHVFPKSVVKQLSTGNELSARVRQWIKDFGHPVPETREGKQELAEKLRPFLNMLGNQALLNDKKNRGARDKAFANKKPYYKKQKLELTNSLSEQDSWGENQILSRQKQLATRAPEIWPK